MEFGDIDLSLAKENRKKAFNVYDAKHRILHNFDSGVKSSSTIGELLGKIDLGDE